MELRKNRAILSDFVRISYDNYDKSIDLALFEVFCFIF